MTATSPNRSQLQFAIGQKYQTILSIAHLGYFIFYQTLRILKVKTCVSYYQSLLTFHIWNDKNVNGSNALLDETKEECAWLGHDINPLIYFLIKG